jgi:hypothetical protein
MKKLLFLLYLSTIALFSQSQTIENVYYEIDGNLIHIFYDLNGLKYYQSADVSVQTNLFNGTLKHVRGDVGNIKSNGKHKITWDVFKETPSLKGNIVFEIQAVVLSDLPKRSWYCALNSGTFSEFGLSIGKINKHSMYASVRMNMNYLKINPSLSYTTHVIANENSGKHFSFDNETIYRRLSVIGGGNFQLHWNAHLYAGLGVGHYQGLWHYHELDNANQIMNSDYVTINNYNFRGIDTEIGIRVQLFKKVLLSAGINTLINQNHIAPSLITEYVFGLGWVFNNN